MTGSDDRRTGRDPDGIRVFDERPRRRTGLAVGLAAAVVLVIVVVALSRREPAGDGTALVASGQSVDTPPKKVVRAPSTPPRDARVAATPSPAKDVPRPPAARGSDDRSLEGLVRDAYENLGSHGNGEGLAAFPPKGTNPPKTGLVVPDDFQLPEGYVRYYQTTDEGRRLEAILMFSPDYEFVDASGNPIELPENGIVPPDMAPPGLPVRMLEIPVEPAATHGQR
jgi:hypothetical protein